MKCHGTKQTRINTHCITGHEYGEHWLSTARLDHFENGQNQTNGWRQLVISQYWHAYHVNNTGVSGSSRYYYARSNCHQYHARVSMHRGIAGIHH